MSRRSLELEEWSSRLAFGEATTELSTLEKTVEKKLNQARATSDPVRLNAITNELADIIESTINTFTSRFITYDCVGPKAKVLLTKGLARLLLQAVAYYRDVSPNARRLSSSLSKGALCLQAFTKGPFDDYNAKSFAEMWDVLVRLCTECPSTERSHHIGFVRTYTKLLAVVKATPALIKSCQAAKVFDHLVGVAASVAETRCKNPMLVGFYVNHLSRISANVAVNDAAAQPLAVRLRAAQVSKDDPLRNDLADVKIWPIVRRTFKPNKGGPPCLGRLLLACDLLENDDELEPTRIDELQRAVLDASGLVASHMFLPVAAGERNLFDHATYAFCESVSRMPSFALEERVVEAAVLASPPIRADTDTARRHHLPTGLLCTEILMQLMARWPAAFGVYSELFPVAGRDWVDVTTTLLTTAIADSRNTTATHSASSSDGDDNCRRVRTFLEQSLSGASVSAAQSSELARAALAIQPCNATSALLLATIATKLGPHLGSLDAAELARLLTHYADALTTNGNSSSSSNNNNNNNNNNKNDCLIIASSILVSYLAKVQFRDIVNVSLRAAVARICQKVVDSECPIGKAFALAAMYSLAQSTGDVRLLQQACTSARPELVSWIQANICRSGDTDGWSDVSLAFLETDPSERTTAEQLRVNEYSKPVPKPFRPAADDRGLNAEHPTTTTTTTTATEVSLRILCELVDNIELQKKSGRHNYRSEERTLLNECSKKLKMLAENRKKKDP